MTRVQAGWLAAAGYLLTILGANWAIKTFPPLPVGFGYLAPAGVYFVAAALVLRDAAQYGTGRGWVLAVMAAGVALSAVVAGSRLALASGSAFAVSELADFGLFTWVAPRWARAVLAGGALGLVLDSVTFLGVAQWMAVPGITLAFLPGQVLGKTYGVIAAAAAIGWRRRKMTAAEETA